MSKGIDPWDKKLAHIVLSGIIACIIAVGSALSKHRSEQTNKWIQDHKAMIAEEIRQQNEAEKKELSIEEPSLLKKETIREHGAESANVVREE